MAERGVRGEFDLIERPGLITEVRKGCVVVELRQAKFATAMAALVKATGMKARPRTRTAAFLSRRTSRVATTKQIVATDTGAATDAGAACLTANLRPSVRFPGLARRETHGEHD